MSKAGGSTERLSLTTKLFYGSGDIFGGGAMVIVGFFFLFFMTEVAHLDPGLAGLVLLVGKIWDAVNDPLMGYLSDRTRSRFGRRRVYFLVGIVPIVLTFTFLWVVPPTSSQWALFAYFVSLSILFDTVLTIVMVPYTALAQEITLDYNERSSLSGYRLAFSYLSSLISAAVPMLIVGRFPDPVAGYRVMGLVFGLFYALPWLGVYAFTRERPAEPESKDAAARAGAGFTLLTDIKETLANYSFRVLMGIYLLAFVATDIISAVIVYYMTYVVGRPGDVSAVLGLLLLLQLAALPFWVHVAKRYGKRVSFIGGAAFWVLVLPFLLAVGPATPIWVVYTLAVLLGAATSGAIFSPWAMLPDVMDVDEVVTGQRRQGVYSGAITFFRKASSALGVFIVGWAIKLSGYVAGSVPPPQFGLVIKVLVAVFPLLPLAVSIWMALRFPITSETHEKVKAELALAGAGELSGEARGSTVSARLYHGSNTAGLSREGTEPR